MRGTTGRHPLASGAVRTTSRRPAVLLLVLLAGIPAAGCGKGELVLDGDREPASAAPPAPAPSSSAAVRAAIPDGLAAPERGAAEIVLKYARAVADGDYARACATRVRAERTRLARASGTCERALLLNFSGRPRELFATMEVAAVRIRGDLAGVDLRQPGGRTELTLAARRVRERWRVEDVPDARKP